MNYCEKCKYSGMFAALMRTNSFVEGLLKCIIVIILIPFISDLSKKQCWRNCEVEYNKYSNEKKSIGDPIDRDNYNGDCKYYEEK